MKNPAFTASVNQHVVFMPKVFDETMQLLLEAREYFNSYGEDDQAQISDVGRSIYASEMSRITLRLSAIMAWIMVQRAVHAGRITPDEAAKHYRLDFKDICLVDNTMLHSILPTHVCHLLDATRELYSRVERLDDQFKRLH
jgi:regulator of CtrA degradation